MEKHLPIVNRRRDLEAAHSGVTTFNPKPAAEVRTQFEKEFNEVGEDLLHMLIHIGEIETRMLKEVDSLINRTRLNTVSR